MAVIELVYEADLGPSVNRDVAVESLKTLLGQLHWPLWMLKEHHLSTEGGQEVRIEGLDFDPDQVEFGAVDEEVAAGRYRLNVSVLRDGREFTLKDRWKLLGGPVNRHVPEPAYFCAWAGFLPLLYYHNDVGGGIDEPTFSYVNIRYDYLEARATETKGFGGEVPKPCRDWGYLEIWDAMRDRDSVLFGDFPPSSMQEYLRLA